jgi:hypothetical protein
MRIRRGPLLPHPRLDETKQERFLPRPQQRAGAEEVGERRSGVGEEFGGAVCESCGRDEAVLDGEESEEEVLGVNGEES